MGIYQNDSYLKLPVYFCKNCKLYVTGKMEDEIKNKTEQLYEKPSGMKENQKIL